MAYTNSEQIFKDVMGMRNPSPNEEKEIDQLKSILGKAGFAIDDPSNAAHVLLLAWGWARATGINPLLMAQYKHHRDIDEKMRLIHQDIEQWQQRLGGTLQELHNRPSPAPAIDAGELADTIKKHISEQPQAGEQHLTVKLDISVLREALSASISRLWLFLVGIAFVAIFFGGVQWDKYQTQPVFAQLQQQNQQAQSQIEKLTTHCSKRNGS